MALSNNENLITLSVDTNKVKYIAKGAIAKVEIQLPIKGLIELSSAEFLPNTPM